MNFFKKSKVTGRPAGLYKKYAVVSLIILLFVAVDINIAISQSMVDLLQGNHTVGENTAGGKTDIIKTLQNLKGKNGNPASTSINTKPDNQNQQSAVNNAVTNGNVEPPVFMEEEEPLSKIEETYNSLLDDENKAKLNEENIIKPDTGKKIRQFGYEYFKRAVPDNFLPVGDGYKVGPGDTISIYFWGDPVDILGLNGFYTITVDRDGKIFVPNLGVFYVWGLDILSIKDIVHKSLAKKFKRFEIALTLGQLRQFPVYVSGYVNRPGVVQSLGTYTIMDVLVQSGGIARNGSLRNIEIVRKGEKGYVRIKVDLYNLFIKGELANVPVKEGDSILVNMIGKTAAVAGDIKRPAIYEIFDNESVKDAIEYAGGLSFSAYNTSARHFRFENDRVKVYEGSLADSGFSQKKLSDGDCISIQGVNNSLDNQITVEGYIKYPGSFEWKKGARLSEILRKAELLPDTDAGVADIRRIDSLEVVSFSPAGILSGNGDIELRRRDVITFYPRWLNEPVHISGEVEESRIVPFYNGLLLLDAMKQIKIKKDPALLKAEIFSSNRQIMNNINMQKNKTGKDIIQPKNKTVTAGTIQIDQGAFDGQLQDNQMQTIKPIESKKKIYLTDLLLHGDPEANIPLEPGDKIVIRSVESNEKNKTVTILGEVSRPGVYRYKPGDKLSDIIEEAGGYSDTAYPRGLIFTRRNAQKLQLNQINITMMSMEEYAAKSSAGLGAAGGNEEEKSIITMMMKQQEEMLTLIKRKSTMALGRLALEIPFDLQGLKESKDNITLVEDDYIFVPAKPNYVLVLGNVYNQISMPHVKGKTVGRYLDDVGGPAKSSDLSSIYVIKANGKIISRESYEYRYGYTMSLFRNIERLELEEGDAVVVPFEINIPVMWRPMLRDITQIIFQSLSSLVLASKL